MIFEARVQLPSACAFSATELLRRDAESLDFVVALLNSPMKQLLRVV